MVNGLGTRLLLEFERVQQWVLELEWVKALVLVFQMESGKVMGLAKGKL
jgi:hypothetical protein